MARTFSPHLRPTRASDRTTRPLPYAVGCVSTPTDFSGTCTKLILPPFSTPSQLETALLSSAARSTKWVASVKTCGKKFAP
eukprot:2687408-Prymnesium_polylepis.1